MSVGEHAPLLFRELRNRQLLDVAEFHPEPQYRDHLCDAQLSALRLLPLGLVVLGGLIERGGKV